MPEQFTYLALALVWALPAIALQWVVGWRLLWKQRRAWFLAVFITTAYLALADSFALGVVWTIHPAKSLGIRIGNVPLEEIVFFLVTNLLVVQTVILGAQSRELVQSWRQRLWKIGVG